MGRERGVQPASGQKEVPKIRQHTAFNASSRLPLQSHPRSSDGWHPRDLEHKHFTRDCGEKPSPGFILPCEGAQNQHRLNHWLRSWLFTSTRGRLLASRPHFKGTFALWTWFFFFKSLYLRSLLQQQLDAVGVSHHAGAVQRFQGAVCAVHVRALREDRKPQPGLANPAVLGRFPPPSQQLTRLHLHR